VKRGRPSNRYELPTILWRYESVKFANVAQGKASFTRDVPAHTKQGNRGIVDAAGSFVIRDSSSCSRECPSISHYCGPFFASQQSNIRIVPGSCLSLPLATKAARPCCWPVSVRDSG